MMAVILGPLLVWATILPAQQAASLAYDLPAGWTQSVNPASGLITLTPPGLPLGRIGLVSVFSPEPFAGTDLAFHNEIIRRLTQNTLLLEPARHGSFPGFLVTTIHQRMANGIQLWATIYTARWADRGQAFAFTANAPDVAGAYFPAVDAMMRRIAIPPPGGMAATSPGAPGASASAPASNAGYPPPPPCLRPQGIEFCPAPIPTGDHAVPITGAYLATSAQTGFHVGAGVESRVETNILLLFANGVAVRAAAMKNGDLDDTYWSEGFATMDPTDPSQIGMRRMGHWTEASGKISITWQIGPAMTLTRDGDHLKEQYTTWAPYPRIDGLKLKGHYQHVVPFGPPWSVTLHRDGTFTSDGLNETMGGTTINPGFPAQGSGVYEIVKWSLVLRFSTGFVQSMNLMLGTGDPANPDVIVVNGTDFQRAGAR